MHPSTEAALSPFATSSTKKPGGYPKIKLPLYDDGGDVSLGSKIGSYAQGTLKRLGEINKPEEQKKPAAAPVDDSINPLGDMISGIKNYAAGRRVTAKENAPQAAPSRMPKIVASTEPEEPAPLITVPVGMSKAPKLYDAGGDVDVNDGQHQVAILQDGEKVLTPEEADKYRAVQQQLRPISAIAAPAASEKARTGMGRIEQPVEPNATEPLIPERGTPQQREHLDNATKNEIGKGNFVGAGTALLQKNHLPKINVDEMQTPSAFQNPGTTPAATQGGSAPIVSGKDAYKAKIAAYDTQYQQLMDKAAETNDPQFSEKADRVKAAKEAYLQAHPWGSPESAHPGILGRIGHVAAKIAERNPITAGYAAMVPGSDVQRHAEAAATQARLEKEAPETTARLNEENKAVPTEKPAEYEIKSDDQGRMWRVDKLSKQPPQLITFDNSGAPTLSAAPAGVQPPAFEQPTFGRTETKQPVGAEGVQRHDKELTTLTTGMSPEDKKQFLDAYAITPEDTLAVQTKRIESARAAAALSGGERDRKLARDQQQKNHEESMAAIAANRAASEGHKDKAEQVKVRQEVAKIYADPLTSAERYNIMTKNLFDALPESQGGKNDQQAMLSLLANHLGMTMGLQKGARLNQAIIDEAAKSQPWISKIGAKFDKDGYLSGLTLGPDQMKSMVNLARERYSEDVSKARNVAKYAGAEDDGPDRTPSTSTMHYYLGLAGGDIAKAKQLAGEDGWTVPQANAQK